MDGTTYFIGVQSMDQEKEEQRAYPEAYSTIPKGIIKEEETPGENYVEQQVISWSQSL